MYIYIYISFQTLCTSSSISRPTHPSKTKKVCFFFFFRLCFDRSKNPSKSQGYSRFCDSEFLGPNRTSFLFFLPKIRVAFKEWVPGWWFQIFFIFTPKLGEDSHFDFFFSKGLKPPIIVHLARYSIFVAKKAPSATTGNFDRLRRGFIWRPGMRLRKSHALP